MMCVVYLNLATTALNLAGTCMVVLATLQVRKAARINREWSALLRRQSERTGA